MIAAENSNRLPAELDNESVILTYGSLLEHAQLRELLKDRGEFEIFETAEPTESRQPF